VGEGEKRLRKRGGAMATRCRECEAIELEYRRASFEYWSNSSVELKEAWGFLRRLAGGSEDDVVRLEELPRPKVTGSSKLAEINFRRDQHWSLTGHYVNLPEPGHPTMGLNRPAGT
jgi:hypothetical protein